MGNSGSLGKGEIPAMSRLAARTEGFTGKARQLADKPAMKNMASSNLICIQVNTKEDKSTPIYSDIECMVVYGADGEGSRGLRRGDD